MTDKPKTMIEAIVMFEGRDWRRHKREFKKIIKAEKREARESCLPAKPQRMVKSANRECNFQTARLPEDSTGT